MDSRKQDMPSARNLSEDAGPTLPRHFIISFFVTTSVFDTIQLTSKIKVNNFADGMKRSFGPCNTSQGE